MSKWPAVDVAHAGDPDLTLAIVDDFAPAAVEPLDSKLRIFFQTSVARDAACAALRAESYLAEPVDVDDEDWARRSQENLKPIVVGRITVAPPWYSQPPVPSPQSLFLVIQPSMGFGTGHHATTRLCLHALQAIDLAGRFVLDVGTGSGVLAIAAVRLGARGAAGVDYDADAIQAAEENLQLNAGVESVAFRTADLADEGLPDADVITANLTGAMLIRSAGRLVSLLRPGGVLLVSGLLENERDDVLRALLDVGSERTRPASQADSYAGPDDAETTRPRPTSLAEVGRTLSGPPLLFWEQHEDGWLALAMKRS